MRRIVSLTLFLFTVLSLLLFSIHNVAAAPKKIITIGDSITWGSCSNNTLGGRDPDQSRTYQGYLRSYVGSSYNIVNYGVSGLSVLPDPYYATVPSEWDKARGAYYNSSVQAALKSAPDVVLIMLGTNDSKLTDAGKAGVWDSITGGEENFYQAYKKLAEAFMELPSHPEVYIMLPPPALPQGYRGRNAYRITNDIQEQHIVPILRNIAEELGLDVIDVRGAFPSATTQNTQVRLSGYLLDCVHPNSRGYELIAKTVAKHLGLPTAPPTQQNQNNNTQTTVPNQNQNQNQNSNQNTQDQYTPPQNQTTPQQSQPSVSYTYSITYDANGGKGQVPVDENKYTQNSQAVVLNQGKLTRKGYRFIGWSKAQDATEADFKAKAKITVGTEDLTLFAVWKRVYSITFISQNEEILAETPEKITGISANRVVGLPKDEDLDYDREQYQFLGWSKTKDGKVLTEETVTIKNGSLKLYAVFEEIPEIEVVEPEPPEEEKMEQSTPEAPISPEKVDPPTTEMPNGSTYALIAVIVVAAVAIVTGLVIWKLRHKKQSDNTQTTNFE